jgi:hypothetical protein
MRKPLVLALAAAAVATGTALAAPASADSALITLPVVLGASTLSLSAPAAVVTPGDPATAVIATTVADLRLSGGNWTATISATDLTLTGATSPGASETIPATGMTAYTTVVTPPVPGTAVVSAPRTSGSPLSLTNSAQTLVSTTSRSNVNTTVYSTTVSIPTTGKTAGVYTGNVVQSVS